MPSGHAAIDVLHDGAHQDMAGRVVRELGELARQGGLPLSIRRLATDDPTSRDIVDLISGPGPAPLGIAVDTELAGQADTDPAAVARAAISALAGRAA